MVHLQPLWLQLPTTEASRNHCQEPKCYRKPAEPGVTATTANRHHHARHHPSPSSCSSSSRSPPHGLPHRHHYCPRAGLPPFITGTSSTYVHLPRINIATA